MRVGGSLLLSEPGLGGLEGQLRSVMQTLPSCSTVSLAPMRRVVTLLVLLLLLRMMRTPPSAGTSSECCMQDRVCGWPGGFVAGRHELVGGPLHSGPSHGECQLYLWHHNITCTIQDQRSGAHLFGRTLVATLSCVMENPLSLVCLSLLACMAHHNSVHPSLDALQRPEHTARTCSATPGHVTSGPGTGDL